MAEVKIQDVFRKLRERKELLTPAETEALFAHLDSLAERIGGLERMLAEARLEGEGVSQQSSTTQVRGKKATARQTSKPGKKERDHPEQPSHQRDAGGPQRQRPG